MTFLQPLTPLCRLGIERAATAAERGTADFMAELVRTAERDSDDHALLPAAWPCGAARSYSRWLCASPELDGNKPDADRPAATRGSPRKIENEAVPPR